MKARLVLALTAVLVAVGLTSAEPARADGVTSLGTNAALVRGGAPLPQFNTNYPLSIGNPAPVGAPKNNFEISLTAPDHSVLHFLFSPRSLSGETPGVGGTAGTDYAGLAWSIFDSDRLFGSVALSGAVNRPLNNDPTTRLYGPLISLHSTLELGYAFDPQQSLSFDLDHAHAAPYFGDRNVPNENLRLQYGYHF